MENIITLTDVEISATDSAIFFKTTKPFSQLTVKKEDFSGVSVIEEKETPHSDWNYAFRFGGIGFVLMLISFAIGYNVPGGFDSSLGLAFVYLGVAFAQLITFGAFIILLSFWDGFFGSKMTQKMLLKLFGKTAMRIIVACKNSENISFQIHNDSDKRQIDKILNLNKIFDK